MRSSTRPTESAKSSDTTESISTRMPERTTSRKPGLSTVTEYSPGCKRGRTKLPRASVWVSRTALVASVARANCRVYDDGVLGILDGAANGSGHVEGKRRTATGKNQNQNGKSFDPILTRFLSGRRFGRSACRLPRLMIGSIHSSPPSAEQPASDAESQRPVTSRPMRRGTPRLDYTSVAWPPARKGNGIVGVDHFSLPADPPDRIGRDGRCV